MEKDVKYIVVKPTSENITMLEKLRYDAYGIDTEELTQDNKYYIDRLHKGKILVFASLVDEEIVSACYVSDSFKSLFIEQLFVKKEYQKSGLRLGRSLLQYIFDNKKIVEEYFKKEFKVSKLSPSSYETKKIYESMDFDSGRLTGIMKRGI